MSRYKVQGSWSGDKRASAGGSVVELQFADIVDTKNGDVFRKGAYRVVIDDKPPRGKGGTVPFYGESAWADGERFFYDTVFKLRSAR